MSLETGTTAPQNSGTAELAAGVDSAGNQYVFWQGADGGLWEKWYSGGWHGPARLMAAGTIGSAPAVAVHGAGEQDVFWKGTDGNLWEMWYSGAWNGPANLGSGPL